MGKIDDATKELMKKNDFFADAFNYLFKNKVRIDPTQLSDVSESEIASILTSDSLFKTESIQKYRDIMKHAIVKKASKTYYILLGIENQTHIDYAMVVRCMLYDALRYWNQVNKIIKERKQLQENYRKLKTTVQQLFDSQEELLKKSPLQLLDKEDKLYPVVTLVLYFGNDNWDGARTLKEMLIDLPEELSSFVNDFKMNLIVPREITNFHRFSTDLGIVMKALSYAETEKEQFHQYVQSIDFLDFDAANVINICTGKKLKLIKKGEKVGMSNIMGLLLDDYKEQGREQGTVAGTLLTLSKYGKLNGEELIEEAVAICGKEYEFVKSIYEELLRKGELK